MFGGTYFDHSLIRKYVIVFGKLFDNTKVERTVDGNTTVNIEVPLSYSTKEKMLSRLHSDPDLDKPYASLLPRMTFEIQNLAYDPDRKLTSVGKKVLRDPNNKNKFLVQYNPVPYVMHFNLYIYAKNQEDGTKIVEQIVPFFTPDWTPSIELIPEMNDTRDCPIILDGVNLQEIYKDDSYSTRMNFLWTLSFRMLVYFFGPVREKPIIKFTTINYHAGDLSANTPAEVITTTQPGLLANGSPTTSVNNSISWTLIDVNDDYGYASQITEPTWISSGGGSGITISDDDYFAWMAAS